MNAADARRLARESRERQGLPPVIEDPDVLRTIAAVLASATGNADRRVAS